MRTTATAVLAALALMPLYALAGQQSGKPCLEPIIACPKPPPEEPDDDPPGPDLTAYRGLGTWVDGYDFSRELKGSTRPQAVDDMAAQGVRTLYIQAAKDDRRSTQDLLSPDLLGQFLEKAHGHGMRVVAWYLPKFTNPAKDWRHLDAILNFRTGSGHTFDSVGLDIEARDVKDPKLRGDRLVALSDRLRAATDLTLSAIVVPPVVLDEINPDYWRDFPWQRLKASYDVWVPMAYYTYRKPESGYRDAYTYTTRNIEYLRRDLSNPDLPVHVAGGLSAPSSTKDVDGLARGARDRGALGISSYDYATTPRSAWATLRKGPS